MKKFLLFYTVIFSALAGKAQFTQQDIIYFVGSGPDTAVLVIDFLDGSADESYAWGYLFDEASSVTASTMLSDIAANEPMLNVVFGGGFLNDIIYNTHSGIGGVPDYWGTWSRTGSTAWVMNGGVSEVLANGLWFGCSYTDFSPAIEPGDPIAAYQSTKFSKEDVLFWVGTGPDSAVLVLDFVTDVYGEVVTYSWGYLFSGSTNGQAMLADIDAADVNLNVVMGGGFLNDITYNGLAGFAGLPDYWGTWSGTNLSDWTMNAGVSTTVNNGDWFGCSYAPWEPRRPFYPIGAISADAFTFNDVTYWVGTGTDSAVVIIDFNESAAGESFAFGYLFNGTVTAAQALQGLSDNTLNLNISMGGGFLNDIVYSSYSGFGGSPYYWGTWSATNIGGWEMNSGVGEVLSDGDWFACTYTAWSPATPPSLPESAIDVSGYAENGQVDLNVYPNPTTGLVKIQTEINEQISVYDASGKLIFSEVAITNSLEIDLSDYEKGLYFITAVSADEFRSAKVIKN